MESSKTTEFILEIGDVAYMLQASNVEDAVAMAKGILVGHEELAPWETQPTLYMVESVKTKVEF